jgi:HSP20 family molecular chaperone IbpA
MTTATETAVPALWGDRFLENIFGKYTLDQIVGVGEGYPTDIVETRDADGKTSGYEIAVALAGIPKENIEVSIEGDTLHIDVRKTEVDNTGRWFISKGISTRAMSAQYLLYGIDRGKIESEFKDGLLKVKLFLSEDSKPKQIKIG